MRRIQIKENESSEKLKETKTSEISIKMENR